MGTLQQKWPPAKASSHQVETAETDTTPPAVAYPMISQRRLMTMPELSEATGVCSARLRDYCRRVDDPLPSVRLSRNGWFRVYWSDFVEWSKRNFEVVS